MKTNFRNHNTFKLAKKAMIDLDIGISELARRLEKSEPYIRAILQNRVPGYAIRPAIAKALGVSIETLWPPESDHISRV